MKTYWQEYNSISRCSFSSSNCSCNRLLLIVKWKPIPLWRKLRRNQQWISSSPSSAGKGNLTWIHFVWVWFFSSVGAALCSQEWRKARYSVCTEKASAGGRLKNIWNYQLDIWNFLFNAIQNWQASKPMRNRKKKKNTGRKKKKKALSYLFL